METWQQFAFCEGAQMLQDLQKDPQHFSQLPISMFMLQNSTMEVWQQFAQEVHRMVQDPQKHPQGM